MYYFFLDTLMLPVPPPKMTVRIGNKNKTISLINEGEVNVLKKPGLTEINFEVLLPNAVYPFSDYSGSLGDLAISAFLGNAYSYQPAEKFYSAMETAKKNHMPVRFIVTRLAADFSLLWDTNLLMSIEECPIKEDAKQGYDMVIPLKLKEYRPYGTKEIEVKKDADGKETYTVKEQRYTDKVTPKAWKTTKEQSIFEAVKLASGGGLSWRQVANLNGLYNPISPPGKRVLRLV